MNDKRNGIRQIAGYGALLILLYWGLNNMKLIGGLFGSVFGLFMPFILGLMMAFVINVPMVPLEQLLFRHAGGRLRRLARPLSLTLTLLLLFGLVFVVCFLVVPELANSITLLGNSIPGYITRVGEWALELAEEYPEIYGTLATVNLDWGGLMQNVMDFMQNVGSGFLSSTVNVASGILNGLFSVFLGLIFAIYILLQKETLHRQAVKLLRSFVPKETSEKTLYVASLSYRTFYSFISGQCLEAFILGMLFFVTMSIFRMPYTLLISVLTGFTALIPVFGAFIGCAVGAFLILMVNPMQALWFVVLFVIIQQLEGNLIYPRVVGGSIGLPAIWVLLAVTIGGSAMGIIGMLVFIPLCSVIYTLLGQELERRRDRWQPKEESDA